MPTPHWWARLRGRGDPVSPASQIAPVADSNLPLVHRWARIGQWSASHPNGVVQTLPSMESSPWDLPLLDRVVLAGALGDAWGYAVEFQHLDEIDQNFGEGGQRLHVPPLTNGALVVSDDTQMTLFSIAGLHQAHRYRASSKGWPSSILGLGFTEAYQAWYSTQMGRVEVPGEWYDVPCLRHRRAPGSTCLTALTAHRSGHVNQPINGSKGCGGVMRAAVLGAWNGLSPDDAWRMGDVAAGVTHGHPDGRWPSAWIAAWVARSQTLDPFDPPTGTKTPLRESAFLDAWSAEAQRLDALDPTSGTAGCMLLAQTLALDAPWSQVWSTLGQGWVGDEALAIAAYAVRRASTLDDAIFMAIYHDGDSDSTGSLAAQIWAAWFGLPASVEAWLSTLDVLPAWRRLRATLIEA